MLCRLDKWIKRDGDVRRGGVSVKKESWWLMESVVERQIYICIHSNSLVVMLRKNELLWIPYKIWSFSCVNISEFPSLVKSKNHLVLGGTGTFDSYFSTFILKCDTRIINNAEWLNLFGSTSHHERLHLNAMSMSA